MLVALGFAHSVIDLIMLYVTTVEFKVIQDDHVLSPIMPGRGLRQGDLISPYLFIICAESLTVLVRNYES